MSVKNLQELQIGTVGFPISCFLILTNNTLDEVTQEGYLNSAKTLFNANFKNGDFANVFTTDMKTIYLQIVVDDGSYSLFNPYAGNGTVSSVALAAPSFLTVTGSPVTTTGTLTLSLSGVALPVSSGGTGSNAALTNGRLMMSIGGNIVESNAAASMNGFRITSLAEPTSATDAVTKNYVDTVIAGPLSLQGNWDASTNTPTLTAGVGTLNYAYYVSVPGTQTLPSGTSTDYTIGDLLYYGANLIWNKLDQGLRVVSINGSSGLLTLAPTANQVNVSTVGTTLTLSTPQDIALSSSPTFVTETLTGLTASQAVVTNGSKVLSSLAYTNLNTVSTLVQRDASGNFSAGTITASFIGNITGNVIGDVTGNLTGNVTGNVTGNASTATALQTARNIGAVSFNGTADIVPQTIQTVDDAADSSCFVAFVNSSGTVSSGQQVKTNSIFTFNATNGVLATNSLLIRNGGAVQTNVSAADSYSFRAYDVDGATYRTFGTLTANNTPTLAFSQPSGGTLTWDGGAIGSTTQANAQFYSPINAQTGTTYTLAASDCGKIVTLSNAAAITLTLPQQSTVTTSAGFWCHVVNIGAGTVTIVKQGSESLIGNTSLVTNAETIIERTTTTNWVASYGTAVVNMPALATINLSITTSNTKDLWCPQANATLLGIRFRAFSVGTAGTFKLQLNGVDITGLTGLVPSTSQTYGYASAATNLVAGDVITIVADGTLVTIADLNITPIYTVTF